MCFSAGASFGASALLGGIGIVAITKAKTNPQRFFASIPLFFSIQQFSEGMLWLSIKKPVLADWQPFFTYTFLVFAMVVWPLLIPLTIRFLEKNTNRKKTLNVLVTIGGLVSATVGCILLIYPVQVMPMDHHLHYSFDFPRQAENLIWFFTILYMLATIAAPFVSGIKQMKWLGVCFFASYSFAVIYYNGFVVSVWCYFAALLSFVVLWIIAGLSKST